MTPSDVRQHLVEALEADLIGPFVPDAHAQGGQEVLPIAPSRWYLTGFLSPQGGRVPVSVGTETLPHRDRAANIPVPPYCPLTDEDREALQAFEDEVIDRLYVLNAERAREEQRLGLAGKKRGRAASDDGDAEGDAAEEAPALKRKGKKAPEKQGKLF